MVTVLVGSVFVWSVLVGVLVGSMLEWRVLVGAVLVGSMLEWRASGECACGVCLWGVC